MPNIGLIKIDYMFMLSFFIPLWTSDSTWKCAITSTHSVELMIEAYNEVSYSEHQVKCLPHNRHAINFISILINSLLHLVDGRGRRDEKEWLEQKTGFSGSLELLSQYIPPLPISKMLFFYKQKISFPL